MSWTFNGNTYDVDDFRGKGYAVIWDQFWTDVMTHMELILVGTSTTSLPVSGGTKVFSIEPGKPFAVGQPVRLARTSSPTDTYMDLVITVYDASVGQVTAQVVAFNGSGTYADWTMSVGGARIAGTLPVGINEGGTGAIDVGGFWRNLMSTPAISKVLESLTGVQDCAIWRPGLDEHPRWYDRVQGARSTFMLATIQHDGVDSYLKVWDMTRDDTPLLQSETIAGTTLTGVRMLGGAVVAFANLTDLYFAAWTTTGWYAPNRQRWDGQFPPGAGSPTIGRLELGYADTPIADPYTGGAKLSYAWVMTTGTRRMQIWTDRDRSLYLDSTTLTYAGVAIHNGRVIFQQQVSQVRITDPISIRFGDGVISGQQVIADSTGNQPVVKPTANAYQLATQGEYFAGSTDKGVFIGKRGIVRGGTSDRFRRGLLCSIGNETGDLFNTGWYGWYPRFISMCNNAGKSRTGFINDGTVNGTVTPVLYNDQELFSATWGGANHVDWGNDGDFATMCGGGPSSVGMTFLFRHPGGTDPGGNIFSYSAQAGTTTEDYMLIGYDASGRVFVTLQDISVGGASVTYTGQDIRDGEVHALGYEFYVNHDNSKYVALYLDGKEVASQGIGTSYAFANGTQRMLAGLAADGTGVCKDGVQIGRVRMWGGWDSVQTDMAWIQQQDLKAFRGSQNSNLPASVTGLAIHNIAADERTGKWYAGSASGGGLIEMDRDGVGISSISAAESWVPWTSDVIRSVKASDGALFVVTDQESAAIVPSKDAAHEIWAQERGEQMKKEHPGIIAWAIINSFSGGSPVWLAGENVRSAGGFTAGEIFIRLDRPAKYPPIIIGRVGPAGSQNGAWFNATVASFYADQRWEQRDLVKCGVLQNLGGTVSPGLDPSAVEVYLIGEMEDVDG